MHGKPRALIVCPTRELALQVGRDLDVAGAHLKMRVLTIYGGTGYDEQLNTLESGIDIAVGTPGRLLDLADRGALDLSEIQVLVLDEADEMLDLGFLPDIERLLRKTPASRQTMLFSATMPAPILALARATLNKPINIRAEGHDAQMTVPDITQFVYQAHDLDKPEIVGRLLQGTETTKVMVFCRTKRAAQRLTDELVDRGFPAAAIHGDLNQQARERALHRWKLINQALNLELGDPAETYSTSPHLFSDLGIPAGTKGRLPGTKDRSAERRAERIEKEERRRSGSTERSGEGRRRSRLTTEAAGDHPAEAAVEQAAKPRRRRRRTRGGVEVPKD